MKKIFWLALFLGLAINTPADAQKGFGSGRISTTPSVRSTPSIAPRVTSPTPRISTPSSSGRSFSSGTKPSTPSVTTTRPSPTVTTPSGKSFSSGGNTSTVSKPVPPPPPVVSNTPSGKSFSSGTSTSTPTYKPAFGEDKTFGSNKTPSTPPPLNVGTKPKSSGIDSIAGGEQKKADSRVVFENRNKPTNTGSTSSTSTSNTSSPSPRNSEYTRTRDLRNGIDAETVRTHEIREREFYHIYYNRPVVVYGDTYSPWFWYWMLDRSLDQQAMWAYHHRSLMAQDRYNDLLAKNADLAARVNELERNGVEPDPTYVPDGMPQKDLMYTKKYVEETYNSGSGFYTFLWVMFWIGVAVFLIWLVFFARIFGK